MTPTTAQALLQHATRRPDDAAVVLLGAGATTTITWRELLVEALCHRDRYRAAGVRRGDTVLISLPHGRSLRPAWLGAALAGAVPAYLAVPSLKQDPALFWSTHAALFRSVDAAVLLTWGGNAEQAGAVLPAGTALLLEGTDSETAPSPGDVVAPPAAADERALLQHSSGTTGLRKGVSLTHAQVAAQLAAYVPRLGIGPGDVVASWLPLYHDMGLVTALLLPVHLGLTTVSMDPFAWSEDPLMLLEAMDRHRATYAWLPNFGFRHLVRARDDERRFDLRHVRALVDCSEPCRAETLREFATTYADRGVRPEQLRACFALAEGVFAATQTPAHEAVRTVRLDAEALARRRAEPVGSGGREVVSTGPPLPGVEVRIAAGAGESVGEIELRGPTVITAYAHDETARRRPFTEDGWYRTGDIGALVGGELVVLGRTDEVIVHHGVSWFAHDVESTLVGVDGVHPGRAVALGVPDPETGSERIEIVVETDRDRLALPDEVARVRSAVRAAVSASLPIAVGRVHVVGPGWLVKSTSGKVSRYANAEKLRAEQGAVRPVAATQPVDGPVDGPVNEQTDDVAEIVRAVVAETFSAPVAEISEATVAADVDGWDSLGHTVLMIRLGRALGVDVPESVASQSRTVGELTRRLEDLRNPR